MDQLITEKLKKDIEIDEPRLQNLKKISEEGKLRFKALNWVLLRPHSTREFKDYLFRKKVEPDFAEHLTQDFIERKYLDDQKFAEWFFEIKQKTGRSNRYIKAELMKKGISKDIIDELVGGSDDELERLKNLVAKKQNISRYQDKTKLTQYLVRQGFSYSDVKLLLENHS